MKLSCYSLLQRDDDDIQIKYCCCNLLLYHSTVYCISFYVQKSVVSGPCDLSLMNDSEVSAMAKKNMATQIMPGVMNSLKKDDGNRILESRTNSEINFQTYDWSVTPDSAHAHGL